MTKKELLEAIEDMPMNTPIKAIITIGEFHSIVCPNLEVERCDGTIKIKNISYDA